METFRIIDLSSYSDNSTFIINNEKDLRNALSQLKNRSPRVVEFIGPSIDTLTIGIGGDFACVMFAKTSGDPPYLWATGQGKPQDIDLEFNMGGTPTPISAHRCLDFDTFSEIIVYYYLNAALPDDIEWEAD